MQLLRILATVTLKIINQNCSGFATHDLLVNPFVFYWRNAVFYYCKFRLEKSINQSSFVELELSIENMFQVRSVSNVDML